MGPQTRFVQCHSLRKQTREDLVLAGFAIITASFPQISSTFDPWSQTYEIFLSSCLISSSINGVQLRVKASQYANIERAVLACCRCLFVAEDNDRAKTVSIKNYGSRVKANLRWGGRPRPKSYDIVRIRITPPDLERPLPEEDLNCIVEMLALERQVQFI